MNLDESSEISNKISARDKYINVQKNIQNAEADRNAFTEETIAVMKKQKTKLEFLRQENSVLKNRITELHQKNFTKKNFMANQQEMNYHQLVAKYKKQFDIKQAQLKKISSSIKIFKKQIICKKNELGGINAEKENLKSINQQIKILENRLDKTKQKFNSIVYQNSHLRKQIDSLEKERQIFNDLYTKFSNQIQQKKIKISEVIELSNNAYQERDQINLLHEKIKYKSQQSFSNFENQLKELALQSEKKQESIEYQNEMNQEKMKYDELEQEQQFLNQENQIQNKKLAKKLLTLHQKLQQDFYKIQITTKVNDFDELVQNFKGIEEKNYKSYNYINELSKDITTNDNKIKELMQQKEELLKLEERSNIDRKKYMDQKNDEIQYKKIQTQNYIFKQNEINDLLREAGEEVENIFYYLGCDRLINKTNLNENLLENNKILKTIGLIEQRQQHLLQTYTMLLEQKNLKEKYELKEQDEKIKQIQEAKKIQDINTLGKQEDENDTDIDNKFLSYEQFRQRGHKKLLLYKDQQAQKSKFKKSINQFIQKINYHKNSNTNQIQILNQTQNSFGKKSRHQLQVNIQTNFAYKFI